ncbi:hypothetical protein D3C80_1484660 [compost metagenome]
MGDQQRAGLLQLRTIDAHLCIRDTQSHELCNRVFGYIEGKKRRYRGIDLMSQRFEPVKHIQLRKTTAGNHHHIGKDGFPAL